MASIATTVQDGDLRYRIALRWSAFDLAVFVYRVTLIDGDLLAGGPRRSCWLGFHGQCDALPVTLRMTHLIERRVTQHILGGNPTVRCETDQRNATEDHIAR